MAGVYKTNRTIKNYSFKEISNLKKIERLLKIFVFLHFYIYRTIIYTGQEIGVTQYSLTNGWKKKPWYKIEGSINQPLKRKAVRTLTRTGLSSEDTSTAPPSKKKITCHTALGTF